MVEVFWRPGCPQCSALRGVLLDHAVETTWRNIWTDREAREIVRAANNGSEVVPTVRVGESMLANPGWRELAPLIDRDPSERPRPTPPHTYASASSCQPPSPSVQFAEWAPRAAIVALILSGAAAAGQFGNQALAVVMVAAAWITWGLTRPVGR